MALGAALVDRAQVIQRVRAGRDSEGGYAVTSVVGQRFRCLLDEGTESESRDDGSVRRSRPATLLVGTRAQDGSVLDIRAHDVVQVTKKLAGQKVQVRMEVSGNPEQIKKKSTVIGATLTLQRVDRG